MPPHDFWVQVRKGFDALGKARKPQYTYSTDIPKNFEDSVCQYRKTQNYVNHLAIYYINTYKARANTTLTDEDQIRLDMFKLAGHSIDEFATSMSTDGRDDIAFARNARNILVQYNMRHIFPTEFIVQQEEVQSAKDLQSLFVQIVDCKKYDPSVIFAIDCTMFNIVRRAQVDTRDAPDKFEDTAKEYIVSALAQIAYSPCHRNPRTRSYQQRVSCLQQLNINSYIFGLIADIVIQMPSGDEQQNAMLALNTLLGHSLVLRCLSHSCYLVKSIVNHISNGGGGDRYVQAMLYNIQDVASQDVAAAFNGTS